MPTGYTADVQSGKVTDFREFAMQCARAFGATILMRDDPMDKPIPDEFKPSSYHGEALDAAQKNLIHYEEMTLPQAAIEARAEYEQGLAARNERMERRAAQRTRYQAMLDQVNAYVVPSAEHVEFKKFMVQQLTESIDFDCSDKYDDGPKFMAGDEWRKSKIERARKDIEYHKREYAAEISQTDSRNQWIRQLRDSLAITKIER